MPLCGVQWVRVGGSDVSAAFQSAVEAQVN
jgi:hypothetical protein